MRGLDQHTAYILELLNPLGPVSARRMFGGVGLFHGGLMFGLIVRDELFLKAGDTNRRDFEAAGEAPFTYDTKNGTHTLESYWHCPPHLLDESDAFRDWARKAVEAAISASRSKPKTRRRTPG